MKSTICLYRGMRDGAMEGLDSGHWLYQYRTFGGLGNLEMVLDADSILLVKAACVVGGKTEYQAILLRAMP